MNDNTKKIEYQFITALLAYSDKRSDMLRKLSEDNFQDELFKNTFKSIKRICEDYPNASDEVIISNLDLTNEEKVKIFSNIKDNLIFESEIDNTLDLFLKNEAERKFYNELSNAIFNKSPAADVRKIIDDVESKTKKSVNSAEKYLNDFFKPIERIQTGFQILDNYLNGGFVKKTISIIGARPSVGKTTFALNIATHNPDLNILFFSLEMSAGMLYDRFVSDFLDINYDLVNSHKLNENQFKNVEEAIKCYKNLKIIDDVNNIEEIVSNVYSYKPDLVIIDFVQIISSQGRFSDNRQRIDYISQQLKRTAKETNSCILTLSQLTREGKLKPTMSALKESGGLEQDGDYIMLLDRPYVNDKSNKEITAKETTLTLEKNKFGCTGEISFEFDGKKQRFTEVETVGRIARPILQNDEDLI